LSSSARAALAELDTHRAIHAALLKVKPDFNIQREGKST
jgi:hypothetical protein